MTPEEVLQVKMTQRLNQGLIAAEDAVIAIRALPVAAAEEPRKEAVVKLLRQTVLDVGGTATQMRMALERGAVVADKVFSPTAGYEGLSAEQVKILKELDKEKEKEEQQRKTQAQTQAQEPQMYGGRGGYVHRPYHRGQGYYRPYFNPHQQFAASGSGYGQQMFEQVGQGGQQQQFVQPQYQAQQMRPQQNMGGQPQTGQQMQMVQQPQHQQQSYPGSGQQQYGGAGQQNMGGSQRPDPRLNAFCYGCGEAGHYARDNLCRPGAAAAFRAKLQQQVAAGVQAAGPAPASNLMAISYTGPAPPTSG